MIHPRTVPRLAARLQRLPLTALLLLAGPPAFAAPANAPAGPITDHFSLRAGFFAPTISTDARFDSSAGVAGTPFNGETDLGLNDKRYQGRVELVFRLRERHRVRIDYLKIARDGDRQLTRQLRFGNSTYNVNDRVLSTVNWSMLGVTYAWSAVRTDRFELGVGIGVNLAQADARGEVRARNVREEGSGVGPIPTVVLDGTWQIARRWSLNGHVQQLSVAVSNVKGSMADYHLDAQYRWVPDVALGVGYSLFKTDVTLKGSSTPGQFALDSRGPELFFRVSF